MKKLDIFNHIFPRQYYDLMLEVAPNYEDMGKRVREVPMLYDLGERFRIMDRFDDYQQILSLASPPLEVFGDADVSKRLARAANDGMAEICQKHRDRFPGFVASLPLNSPDGLVTEARRAVTELGACGVQVFSNAKGKPLDAPEILPLFDVMAELDLPMWLHPARPATHADYVTEDKSKYEIWWTFGWPYETSAAMARIVFAGVFDKHPNLKIITHHMGGMIPYFEGRVGPGWDQLGSRTSDEDLTLVLERLKKRPYDYFKMFYADTAVFGARAATECGLSFFGPDHVPFASDSPFDPEKGPMYIRQTIDIVDALDVSEQDREKIYRKNALKLLKLNGGS